MSADYHRVDPSCENAVVSGWPVRGPGFDAVYGVDGEGWLRYEDGTRVPDVGPRVVAVDVDPEAWGDHYHHPADCPEREPPFALFEMGRRGCDDCSAVVEKEHDHGHYRPDDPGTDRDPGEVRADVEEALAEVGPARSTEPVLIVSGETVDALRKEAEFDNEDDN